MMSQSFEEHRRIVDKLKRYEDITYGCVTGRMTSLKQELASIFQPLPQQQVINDRRVRERRQVDRPVAFDQRRGTDRRASR